LWTKTCYERFDFRRDLRFAEYHSNSSPSLRFLEVPLGTLDDQADSWLEAAEHEAD
jgi:hypothetical protein